MKKVVLIALAIVMALGCVSAFAACPRDNGNDRELFGTVDFTAAAGAVDGSFLSNDYGSDTNQIREDWTNSRGLDNAGATFVNIGTEEDEEIAVKVTGTCYANADFNANNSGSTANVNLYAYVDLKYVAEADFCGIVMDQTSGLGSGATEFTADNGFVLTTGYGFTLRAGNKLEAFISGSTGAKFDSAVYNLADFGVDASEWNSYAIYRTTDGKATIAVNNIKVAVIDNAAGKIYEADGATIGTAGQGDPSDTNADRYNTDGTPFFAVVSKATAACEVYFDNIGYEEFEELPEFDTYEPEEEEKEDEEEEAEEETKATGDVSMIVAVVAVAALAVVVLKKKETI